MPSTSKKANISRNAIAANFCILQQYSARSLMTVPKVSHGELADHVLSSFKTSGIGSQSRTSTHPLTQWQRSLAELAASALACKLGGDWLRKQGIGHGDRSRSLVFQPCCFKHIHNIHLPWHQTIFTNLRSLNQKP